MKNIRYIALFLTLFSFLAGTGAYAQIIRTVAGIGSNLGSGYFGNGPALSVTLSKPTGIAVDRKGNIYFSDYSQNLVRKVDPAGNMTIVTGTYGVALYSGDNGPATAALVSFPLGVCVDDTGNLYIADAGNLRIRKVDTFGIITTFAGNGYAGVGADGLQATAIAINGIIGVYADHHGNVYFADATTRVRKVDVSGIVHTVAGSGSYGTCGDGGPATNACIDGSGGVCVDNFGNIYFCDNNSYVIRRVDALTGIITRFAGTGTAGYSGDGGPATAANISINPFGLFTGMKTDDTGNLYFADQGNHRIRKVTIATGKISTFAGLGLNGYCCDGGAPTSAKLSSPGDLCFDTAGHMFIADMGTQTFSGHRIREIFQPGHLAMTITPGTEICYGTHVALTASAPFIPYGRNYRWKINGFDVLLDTNYFATDSFHNGDVITCTLMDTLGHFPLATGDTFVMTVHPILVPHVSFTRSADTLCSGIPDTFTATAVYPGSSPVYTWYRFGTVIGTGNPLIYYPSNGDNIRCFLTSNAVCAIPDTASASHTIIVYPSYAPTVTIYTSHNDTIGYWGQMVTLFTEVTFGGSSTTYQWYHNGVAIPGGNGPTLSLPVYADDTFYCTIISNLPCAVPVTATSNVVHLNIGSLAVEQLNNGAPNVDLWPSPTNGRLNLRVANVDIANGRLAISVSNAVGQIVFQTELPVVNGQVNGTIELPEALPSGPYYLQSPNTLGIGPKAILLMH